ncbi:MAG: hypothetical protein ACTSW1_07330 [Candidatus Hodarchaeales archaeon]
MSSVAVRFASEPATAVLTIGRATWKIIIALTAIPIIGPAPAI